MIVKEKGCIVKGLAGGEGTCEVYDILSESELLGHGTLYAKVVIHPLSSVGWHTHDVTTEPYYIVSGSGIFTDNDKKQTTVIAGDICKINVGDSHSLFNPSKTENLVIIALIINK